MDKLTERLVFYILYKAKERNIEIGATRIQKLLYLVDVETVRRTGERATDLNWTFYKYGPYAVELEHTLQKLGIVEEHILSGDKTFRKLQSADITDSPEIPSRIKTITDQVLKSWLDAYLPRLIDYVYYETEPMLNAKKRGENLDFSTITSVKEKRIQFTPEEKQLLKRVGKKIKQALDRIPIPTASGPIYPPDTAEMIRIWDESEGLPLRNLEGTKVIFLKAEDG